MMRVPEDLRSYFAIRGVRWTRRREEIFAALCACAEHPTAEELFQKVGVRDEGMSLATVYSTLELFTRRGLCRRINPAHGPDRRAGGARYDADTTEHAHVVTADGRVIDLPDDLGREVLAHLPTGVLEAVRARTGVRVGRISIEFIEEA